MIQKEIPFNRILMVDDSELDFYIVKEMIKRRKPSATLYYAMDVDTAMQMIKAFPPSEAPDLILLDLHFNRKKKQGIDFLQEYGALGADQNPGVKVIVLTAYAAFKDGHALKKDFSNMEILEKPFSVEQLMYPSQAVPPVEGAINLMLC
jgi:CheY-like chemotaxis protein